MRHFWIPLTVASKINDVLMTWRDKIFKIVGTTVRIVPNIHAKHHLFSTAGRSLVNGYNYVLPGPSILFFVTVVVLDKYYMNLGGCGWIGACAMPGLKASFGSRKERQKKKRNTYYSN